MLYITRASCTGEIPKAGHRFNIYCR